jgi:hypothetical protein
MKRRLSALATLAKIQERELDVRASGLIELQSQKQLLLQQHDELERRRIDESYVTLPEAMSYLGYFLDSVHGHEAKIVRDGELIDRKIETQHDEVLKIWQESKTTRHLEEDILERLKSESDAREQAQMEERSVIFHARTSLLVESP